METLVETPIQTLETVPPSAKAAHSGMQWADLNFQAIIASCAKRKASNGHTVSLVSKKGKATLFSAVAAQCKSQSQVDSHTRLTDEQVAQINSEIALFWKLQGEALLAEGYVQTGLRKHVPTLQFDLDDRKVASNFWKATATYELHRKSDAKLRAMLFKAQLLKRQATMLENTEKFDRSAHSEIALKIEVTENYIKSFEPAPKAE